MDATKTDKPLGLVSSEGLGPLVGHWYFVSTQGMVTLCKDKADAIACAAYSDISWPRGAPHTVMQLADAVELARRDIEIERLVNEGTKVNKQWTR